MTPKHITSQFSVALVIVNVAPLLVGFTLGISSSAAAQLNLDISWKSSFSSYLNIGGLMGCLIAGDFLERVGRKMSLILGGIVGLFGWIIIILHKDVGMDSSLTVLNLLIFGRALTGVSIGIYNTAGLPYVLDIIDPKSVYRDTLPCTCQLAQNLGSLLAFAFGLNLFWWQTSAVILVIEISLTLVLYLNAIPESPKWLLKNNRRPEAESAFMLLHQSQMNIEKNEFNSPSSSNNQVIPKILDTILPCRLLPSSYSRQVRNSMILVGVQQLTGINALMFYTESICGRASDFDPPTCAFFMILIQGVFSLVSLLLIDKYPRKQLLIVLGIVMGICLFLFSIFNMRTESGDLYFGLRHSGFLSLTLIGLYFIAYAVSWGPLPMIVCLELFPPSYSGPISAAGLAVNWILSFFVTNYFLAMLEYLGFGMTFMFYSLSCFLSCWFVARFLPETSSKFSSHSPILL